MNSGSPGSVDILALLQHLPAETRQQLVQQFIAGGIPSPAQGVTQPAISSSQPLTSNEASRTMPSATVIASQPASTTSQPNFAPPPASTQGNFRSPLSQLELNGNTPGYGSNAVAPPMSFAAPPPVLQPYTSARSAHTATRQQQSPPNPQAFQPFVAFAGAESLSIPFSTSHANQARLAHASASLPQAPGGPTRRRRGRASHTPSLPSAEKKNAIESCKFDGPQGAMVMLTALVYPPSRTVCEFYQFRHLRDSFTGELNNYGLVHHIEVLQSTKIVDLIAHIVGLLQHSPMRLTILTNSSPSIAAHENLPLFLLGLSSSGRPRAKDGQVVLRPEMVRQDMSVLDLMANKKKFAHESCIHKNRFVVNFAVPAHLIAILDDGRRHTCLSQRIHAAFPKDNLGHVGTGADDDDDTSGGEEVDGNSDVEVEASLSARTEHSTQASLSQLPTPSHINSAGPSSHPEAIVEALLPARIWNPSDPWNFMLAPTIPAVAYGEFAKEAFARASQFSINSRLVIEAASMPELAEALEAKIRGCASVGDYTSLMSSERHFHLISGEDSSLTSLGEGLERETVYLLFRKFASKSAETLYFVKLADGRAAIRCQLSSLSLRHVDQDRLVDMEVLGATTALMILSGQCPDPLNPLVIHFIAHGCNIHALYPSLVGEWHPELKHTIEAWHAAGPSGDLAPFVGHFATFHDRQVGSYQVRSEAAHFATGVEMLYAAILGHESYLHPEWAAFARGLSLPCRSGFRLTEFLCRVEGGSETALSLIWTGLVTGFASIEPHMEFSRPSGDFSTRLSSMLGSTVSIEVLVRNFLSGSGVPCPSHFEEAKAQFNSLVDLSDVNKPHFRARMFTWAVTGSPFVSPDEQKMNVIVSSDDDLSYHHDQATRVAMIREGRISCRTCFRQIRLPASHILKLAGMHYSPATEPSSFSKAFEHWLLCEAINAIGGMSML